MKLSDGVEWALHVTTLVAFVPADQAVPAARLAEYHGVPAAYLAKHLQALSRAGILEAVPGPHGGYRLARPAAEVTVLDVVEAIDGTESAFVCTEIRQRGPAAGPPSDYRVPCGIHRVMNRADRAWRDSLRAVTIAEIAEGVVATSPAHRIEAGARWMEEVLR